MSVRRKARQRDVITVAATAGGVPAALRVGRLVEVWADPESASPKSSASRRWSLVRWWWLESAGMGDPREAAELLPMEAPWCFAYLSYIGQAERVGRQVDEIVDERLARAGVTRADLPDLRTEAHTLYVLASRAQRGGLL